MTSAIFTDGGKPIPNDPVKNIFVFCCLMAAYVCKRRQGKRTFDYVAECASFMEEVVGLRLSVADPLPPEFSWTPADAIECADAMLEYDS